MTGVRRRQAVRWAFPFALLVAALVPASASAAGNLTCEASALHGTLLSSLPVGPLAANAGQPTCKAQTGGLAPALPLPLSVKALHAKTTLTGTTAGASAGVADLKIQALPEIDLPAPDFGPNAVIPLTVPGLGTISVDLRPALEGLLQPLPQADLLHVNAVESTATARCGSNGAQLTGSSTVTGLSIGGHVIAIDQPVTETVALIDTQSIDPSDIDLAKVVLPAGVNLSAVQLFLKPVLDALPTISVPPTVAHVKVVPKRQIRTGTQLTQRALDIHASIAGRTIADLAVGEAVVGATGCSTDNQPPGPNDRNPPQGGKRDPGSGPGKGTADEALRCTGRRLTLIDVVTRGNRVQMVGAADRRFAGRRVAIKFMANGKTVARPKVRSSGIFTASAPLPARAIRATSRARYQARIGRERSLSLKLVRRVQVTRTRALGKRVTMSGRLIGPLAATRQAIVIKQRVSCTRWRTVKRVMPAASGRFRVTVPRPARGGVAVYRLQTRVASAQRTRLFPTFSLPQYVEG